jgi:arginyl-tRNA synthetase
LARLALLKVLQGVIREGLEMLGVSAPEKMERTEEQAAG